jgi:hypothetical protein
VAGEYSATTVTSDENTTDMQAVGIRAACLALAAQERLGPSVEVLKVMLTSNS